MSAFTFKYPDIVPAGARARIDLVLKDADEAFWTVKNRSLIPDGDGGYSYNKADAPTWARAAIDSLVGIVDTLIHTLSRVAEQRQWPVFELQETVDDLVEQRLVWIYVHQLSSPEPTLEAFTEHAYSRLQQHEEWAHLHTPVPIGTQLTALREKSGWTVDELAEEVDLDRSSVLDHCGGKSIPRSGNLLKYEAAFSTKLNRAVKLRV